MRADASQPQGSYRMLGGLALAATLAARVVADALPGSVAGIERWIEGTQLLAAVLSQLTVVFGSASAVGLLISTLWNRRLPYAYRVYAFPATAAVLTLVALSVRVPLETEEARVLGVVAISLALAASLVGLPSSVRRAASLVLLATAVACTTQLAAHALATLPETSIGPRFARPFATFAHLSDFAALTLATAWLVSRTGRVLRGSLLALAAFAAVLAWGAVRGSADGATLWQVLASRSFSDMAPTPKPLLSDMGIYWVDACALGSAAILIASGRLGPTATAMGLALLVRADPDIPMCALMLALASLLTALAEPAQKPATTPTGGRSTDQERVPESEAGRRALPETVSS